MYRYINNRLINDNNAYLPIKNNFKHSNNASSYSYIFIDLYLPYI